MNTPQTMNFRQCTSQINFAVCPIVLVLLGAANNHSVSHPLNPWFNNALSVLLTSHLFWANTLLHFLPTAFKLLPVFDHLYGTFLVYPLSGNDPNYAPYSLSLNYWFSNGVTVCPLLLPIPFLVFFSILLGFVSVTPLTSQLVIGRPTQASSLRNR